MKNFPQAADYLAYCVNNKVPVSFLKYGDGEYQCSQLYPGHNCDSDQYTISLSNGILNSFKYLGEKENILIGGWHSDERICNYWQSLVQKPINWVDYHSIIIDVKDITTSEGEKVLNNKIDLFKSIQNTQLPKIIVCNELLQRAGIFLKADKMVYVPLRNWFDKYFGKILQQIISVIQEVCGGADSAATSQCIIIFSTGMSSKVLVGELHKIFPQNIYLDFGSALDLLCTQRDSRGRGYSYETLCEKLAPILPTDEIWNDPKYNVIYSIAKKQLGIHL